MSKVPGSQGAPEGLTPGPARDGETQSAPPVAPTPWDVEGENPTPRSERGVNPHAIEESQNLRKGVASLDDPTAEDTETEDFPTDPDTGGLPADHVRNTGPKEMDAPPEEWDQVDEESDESFPASDPPGNY